MAKSLSKSLTIHWWQLLALALNAVVVAGAFWVGFDLGQTRGAAPAVPPSPTTVTPAQFDGLKDEITALRQQGVVLERTRQIEQETNRSLQDQLKQVQGERLALVKEASYLKRLIQEGGRGAVRVQDLRLSAGDGARAVRYAFTLTQLIPGLGESQGQVKLAVTGIQKDQARSFDLEGLPDAEPPRLNMRFDHFQSFQGGFSLPEGFVPKTVEITLVPEGEQLTATSETFPWVLGAP